MMTRIICNLLLVMSTFMGVTALAADQFKMLSLQYRLAQDILPTVESLVGPTGSVKAIDNHLLVTTTPERMAQIEMLISKLDVARKNLRITVSHSTETEAMQRGAGLTARGRVGNVEIAVPPNTREGIHLDLMDRQQFSSNSGSEFLTVTDGEQAFIKVGQAVPYTQQWMVLTQRYAQVQQTVEFYEITTGFAVRPRYIADQVELEITPRIARMNQAGFIDFQVLSTVVRVTPGEWFDLGGSMQDRDDVSRAILSRQSGAMRQNSTLKIRVD